ncbi:hypothetical protein [Cellulomonas sp. Leaf334]|uniref:hypothetical protein n=1 Tax=Cellulomonas sp. Leaf334 TaxID=1736339 RepID=UPI0006F6619E|nr:hypothetical protein [Cellulomonas sp. Leaf334]KQR17575.1 hypothetical protein ASF78_09935 [Cellulomonas sp. Leaf334]
MHAIRPTLTLDRRADIVLEGPELLPTAYDVKTVAALHPSLVSRYAKKFVAYPAARPLVITESATSVALDAARDAGLSVLVAPERGPVTGTLIDRDGRSHTIETSHEPPNDPPTKPGRSPWGQLALTLALLNDPTPRSQTELARETDLTQARVSQSFKQLNDMVERRHDGWTIRRRELASNWLVENYPRPKTSATWLTLDAPVLATTVIAEVLSDAGVEYAVTGQVAADRYAPWARPDRTTIWAERLVDLSAARCTPVVAADATVTIVVPDDPRALHDAVERDGLRLSDPWRVWVTLTQDGDEAAANHLRARLLDGAGVPT